MANVEAGGSGMSSYSPLSTLKRQYADGVGKRLFLFVRTNANCCFDGGVESIMKLKQGAVATPLSTEQQDLGDSQHSNLSDPFSFLSEDGPSEAPEPEDVDSKKGPNLGRFLKKVGKSASKSLERGMHSLAIRADGGKNPDLLALGLYSSQGHLLSMTESQPLPSSGKRQAGLRFAIPLVVPGNMDGSQQLVIKLWIRSGATLLQQTKAAKNFLIGSGHVNISQMRQGLQANKPFFLFQLILQSVLVVDGALTICVTPDLKFPALCGRGWSLADPDVASYSRGLFNLPLDQSYGFSCPGRQQATILATERSIESAVVLPVAVAFMKLATQAAAISLKHAETAAASTTANRHDAAVCDHADCTLSIGYAKVDPSLLAGRHLAVSASWQRPDSIFEVDLLSPTSLSSQPSTAGFVSSVNVRFFPKPARIGILPGLMLNRGGRLPPCGFLLGNVRIQVTLHGKNVALNEMRAENPFGLVTLPAVMEHEVWECLISLDDLLQGASNNTVLEFPLHDLLYRQVGSLVLSTMIIMQGGDPVDRKQSSAVGGLVSLVGLSSSSAMPVPILDFESRIPASDPLEQRRQQQLSTMGNFLTPVQLGHVTVVRQRDLHAFRERTLLYQKALAKDIVDQSEIEPHKDRSPKPFRPSSSRPESLLSAIPFNVHTASLSLGLLDPDDPAVALGRMFTNVTCGAPSDHANGFGNVFPSSKEPNAVGSVMHSPVNNVYGGLRRLETKRYEIAECIVRLQSDLCGSVAAFFQTQRQSQQTSLCHVPSHQAEIQNLRWKCSEAIHSFSHITWLCAIRRTNVFAQALGIALTAYLASLSDPEKAQSTWPEVWARDGYLVSFEGLLSAAGKELGMIEDASVGINMLRMVQVVLIRDDGVANSDRTLVPGSPYISWINIMSSGEYATRQFIVQLGILPSYFDQRLPMSLRNVPVRFYPLLFEVGVDIRQWGANTGANMKTQLEMRAGGSGEPSSTTSGLIDDEDDDVGVADDDVLVQLNYEALRLLNAYASCIFPANSQQTVACQKTHPLLETLYQHIVSSAGKMNHDILDEAATLVERLGGGTVVFCKSGKDRTAMHVTFKQAQFLNRYRQQILSKDPAILVLDTTLEDATLLRIYGTRLPICEKNVGQALYAFNSLQVKFMPDALKPPMNTLAGFLKGGKVFSGGGIES